MAFDIATLETDLDAEAYGVWTPDLGKGLKLKVARLGNTAFTREMTSYTKSQMGPTGGVLDLDEDVAYKVLVEIYSRTILMDWEGLEENGIPQEYSQENAVRLMLKYPDLFKLAKLHSSRAELFRVKRIEEDAGNSSSA